ncbi:adenosylhomocysteinase [Mycetocola saprophilus]|uniref:adenosylhomocysteinase n=1 Tax=Mycetocola saprophilus TaxID=76636 RepID=UPI003BF0191C
MSAPLSDNPRIRAQRLIRLAAARTNLLFAGTRIEVRGQGETARALRSVLGGFGARLAGSDRARLVFLAEEGTVEPRALAAEFNAAEGEVPTLLVSDDPGTRISRALTARGWTGTELRAGVVGFIREGRAIAVIETFSTSGADNADARIDWAWSAMPATQALAEDLATSGLLRGRRVGVSLVLEPKTAALALALRDTGAEVAVFSAASETDPAVAAALGARGVRVFAPAGHADTPPVTDADNAAGILEWSPDLLIDDGSHLVRLAHTERRGALGTLRGAAEETTSGVRPLVEMAAEGELRIPVIAVNDARTKGLFDNLHGTGQSCVLAIADLLDPVGNPGRTLPRRDVIGATWLVIGFGPVGQGVARHAAALGARVLVLDRDPVRALAAAHDGYGVIASIDDPELDIVDVVVSATGVWHTVGLDLLARVREDTVIAVAGGIDDEIALDDARAAGWTVRRVEPDLSAWSAPASPAKIVYVLADGGGVNYTAAEGNPIEVMDLSFATQLVALRQLCRGGLEPGLHPIDTAAEAEVAALVLEQRMGRTAVTVPTDPGRAGGAAQHWSTHRYRAEPSA